MILNIGVMPRLSAQEKAKILSELKEGVSQGEVANKYGVSRISLYQWQKQLQTAGHLNDKFRRGGEHHRSMGEKDIQGILDLVASNPEFSVAKVHAAIRDAGVEIGYHGVQSVMERYGLRNVGDRMDYARRTRVVETEVENITPDPLPTPVLAYATPQVLPAPPPGRWPVRRLGNLVGLGAFLGMGVGIGGWWLVRLLAIQETNGARAGIIFAALALVLGMGFFIYSLKYYLSIGLVLSYSSAGLGVGTGQMKKTRSGWLTKLLGANQTSIDIGALGMRAHLDDLSLANYPFVSVQIPFYNERMVVERSIQAALNQDYPEFEVMLADDSTDQTTRIIENFMLRLGRVERVEGDGYSVAAVTVRPGVVLKHVHRTNRSGFKGMALDLCLHYTDDRAEYISIFDADFVPYPDTLIQFAKYFEQVKALGTEGEKVAAVQGYQWHVLNKSENWITRGVRTEYAGSYVIERAGGEIYGGLKQISGSVYMISRKVLESIGWGSSITEDFELTLKLYERGYKVLYTPYIQAPAECVSTLKRLIRQRMRWAEGHSQNIKKMFWRLALSNKLTVAEKLELVYLAPYYLQAATFLLGTVCWFLSETVFKVTLPFWTSLWGWSLVISNLLALPLMNGVGIFLEEGEERDYVGLVSFIALSYLVVPFQAYAAIKGFIENKEGPWFRTPKTGRITDIYKRGRFLRFISQLWPVGGSIPQPVVNFSLPKQKDRRVWSRVVTAVMLILSLSVSYLSSGIKAMAESERNGFGLGNVPLESSSKAADREIKVVAINTDKAVYSEGEKAKITLGVLDNLGKMVCDAEVDIKITAPGGIAERLTTGNGLVRVNPECAIYAKVEKPDMEADYKTMGQGEYGIEVRVTAWGKSVTKQSSFRVEKKPEVQVTRLGATRIFPTEMYEMKLILEAKEDLGTVKVAEKVPSQFVVGADGAKVFDDGYKQILEWEVKLGVGQAEVKYVFDSPDKSPDYFELGRLSVVSGTGEVVYKEARKWELAIDAPTGNGMLIYSEDAANNVNNPHNRTWTPSDLASETDMRRDGTLFEDVNHTLIEAGTTRNEYMRASLDASGVLNVEVFDGSSWSFGSGAPAMGQFTASIGTTDDVLRAFDIAYETTSGDGLVVYEDTTTDNKTLKYRTWNGSTWSAESSLDYSSVAEGGSNDQAETIELERRVTSGANEIMLGWKDATGDGVYAAVWDGGAWQNISLINGAGINVVRQSFDVAWEGSSDQGMIVYGTGTTTDYSVYDISAATWTDGSGSANPGEAVDWLSLGAEDSSSDYIAMIIVSGASTTTSDVAVDMWNGSDWSTVSTPTDDTDIDTYGFSKGADVEWEATGDRALFAWRDDATASGLTTLRYMVYDRGSNAFQEIDDNSVCLLTEGGAGTTETVTALGNAEDSGGPCTGLGTWAGTVSGIDLVPDPNSSAIMILAQNETTLDIRPEAQLWNGDANGTWLTQTANMGAFETDASPGALATSTVPIKAYDFAWRVSGANSTGMLVYDEDGANVNQPPHYRTWSSSDFSSESNQLDYASNTPAEATFSIIEPAPTRNEYMGGFLQSDGHLTIQMWDGDSWEYGANAPDLGNFEVSAASTNAVYRIFDIAYEQSTGDALVVYENSTTGDGNLKYRTWDGSAWSAEATIDYSAVDESADVAGWIELESRPNSDNILLGWVDQANDTVLGAMWDGSTWNNISSISTSGLTTVRKYFDIAWEGTSDQGMIVYGTGTTTDYSVYDISAGTWTDGSGSMNPGEAVDWLNLAGDINSDYVAMIINSGASGTTSDVGVDMWNGSDWSTVSTPTDDTDIDAYGFANGSDVEWERTGDRALFVWRDDSVSSGLTTLRYMVYDRGSNAFQAIDDNSICLLTEGGAGTTETVTGLANAEDSAGPCTGLGTWAGTVSGIELVADPSSSIIAVLGENETTLDIRPEMQLWNGDANGSWLTQTANMGAFETDAALGALPTATSPTLPYAFAFNLSGSGIAVGGSCKTYDQSTNCTDSQTVRVAVNAVLQSQTTTTSTGSFNITGVFVPSGATVTVFLDGVADGSEAVGVTKYDGTGDITGVLLYAEHLTIGSADNQTISNSDMSKYDNSVSGDEDIFFDISSGNDLTVDSTTQSTQEELFIVTGNTYRPASAGGGDVATHDLEINGTITADSNAISLSGSWDNNATFTAGTSLVTFTASSGTETIDSTGASVGSFNDVTFGSGSGTATWNLSSALDVDDDVIIAFGTLGSNSQAITVGGDWTNNDTFSEGTQTVTFDGANAATIVSGCSTLNSCSTKEFYDLVINKTNSTDTVTLSTNGLEVSNTLTLTKGQLVQGALDVRVEGTTAVSVGASGSWYNVSTGDLTLGGTFANAGSVTFQGNGAACGQTDDIAISSTTTDDRNWSGAGSFSMNDVTVADQASTPTITVYSGTNTSAAANWTFTTCPVMALAVDTATSNTIKVDVPTRYRMVMKTDDTTDYMLWYDRAENDSSPSNTYEMLGPYIREAAADYQLRYDGTRVSTVLEAEDSRVRIRVAGCFENTSGGAGSCLTDGANNILVTEEYTFTTEGVFVANSTNFRTSGVALDTPGGTDNNGYNFITIDGDISDSAFAGTLYYGDGNTESSISADNTFANTNRYAVYAVADGSSFQSAMVGLSQNGWLDQAGGTANWRLDVDRTSTIDTLSARQGNVTPTGSHTTRWYFQFQTESELDTEVERESFANDISYPDEVYDTLTTGTLWNESGRSAAVESFTTGDYLTYAESGTTGLDLTDYTVEAWVYFDTLSTANQTIAIKGGANSTSANYWFGIATATDELDCGHNNGANFLSATSTTANLVTGTWYHLACSYDDNTTPTNDTLSIYVNGTRVATTSQDGAFSPGVGDGDLYVSDDQTSWGGAALDGRIDELRISNSARYSGASITVPTGPFAADGNTAALYHFNQGQPIPVVAGTSTTRDDSGNSFNLTFQGTTTWSADGYIWEEFNELEGAYTLDMAFSSSQSQAQFDLDGGTFIRHNPVVKLRNFRGQSEPATITLEGATLTDGTDYNSAIKPISDADFYDSSLTSYTQLAVGGNSAETQEYLNDTSNDYTFNFDTGDYAYFGSDSKFTGMNLTWATPGSGSAPNVTWEYCSANSDTATACDTWTSLSVTDTDSGANDFTANGHFGWSEPSTWTSGTVNSGPSLYYIRGALTSGSFSTAPVEDRIRTDIILMQYTGNVSSNDQTLVVVPENLWPLLLALPVFAWGRRRKNG